MKCLNIQYSAMLITARCVVHMQLGAGCRGQNSQFPLVNDGRSSVGGAILASNWAITITSPGTAQRGVPPAVMLRQPISAVTFCPFTALFLEHNFVLNLGQQKAFKGPPLMDGGPPIIADTSPFCRIASEQHPSPPVTQSSVLPGDHLTTERCYLPSKETNIHYIQILL